MTPAAAGDDGPRLPLSALLSQALVAFTIEFDNEAEHQIPHRTARHGSTPGGVWLVSMAMWLNCMRYVSAEPITVGELVSRARCGTNLDGMRRRGYVTLAPHPADTRVKTPDHALLIAATRRGVKRRPAPRRPVLKRPVLKRPAIEVRPPMARTPRSGCHGCLPASC